MQTRLDFGVASVLAHTTVEPQSIVLRLKNYSNPTKLLTKRRKLLTKESNLFIKNQILRLLKLGGGEIITLRIIRKYLVLKFIASFFRYFCESKLIVTTGHSPYFIIVEKLKTANTVLLYCMQKLDKW